MSRRVDGVGTGAVVARRPFSIAVLSYGARTSGRSPLGLLYRYPWSNLLVSLHAASNRKTRQAAQFAHSLGVAERTKLSQHLRGQPEVISASLRQHAPSLGTGGTKTAFLSKIAAKRRRSR